MSEKREVYIEKVERRAYDSAGIVKDGTNFHLYFTIEGRPKEGEWVFYPKYVNPVRQYKAGEISNTAFKIVGSTDKSLGLPGPSDSFKQYYCENSIDIAHIVFEQQYIDGVTDGGRRRRFYGDWLPKLSAEGNLIFTSPIPTLKDILNQHPHLREEFDEAIYSAMKHVTYTPAYKLTEWKSENGFVWN